MENRHKYDFFLAIDVLLTILIFSIIWIKIFVKLPLQTYLHNHIKHKLTGNTDMEICNNLLKLYFDCYLQIKKLIIVFAQWSNSLRLLVENI